MNRLILSLALSLVAVPASRAQYYGEDPAQRQMRESRERSAAQQQAAQLAMQTEQLQRQARQLEQQRKQQQARLDDLEYQMRRVAPAAPPRPTRPASPSGKPRESSVYDRLAEYDAKQSQPAQAYDPFESGGRQLMEGFAKADARAETTRIKTDQRDALARGKALEEEREALARGRAIEMAFRAQADAEAEAEAKAAPVESQQNPTEDNSAEYERLANASRDRALKRFPVFANPDSPWRKKLDVYVTQRLEDPARDAYFEKPDWPERIILEFGLRNNLIDSKGNPVSR